MATSTLMGPVRRYAVALLAGLALTGIAATSATDTPSADTKRFFTIAAGAPDSVGALAAGGICRLLARLATDAAAVGAPTLRCALQLSGGAGDSLAQLLDRRVAFALLPAPLVDQAYRAGEPGHAAQPGLRAVFALYTEPFHLVAGRDAGIGSLADLRGRRVSLGGAGTSHRQLADALLITAGLRHEDLALAAELPPGRQVPALCGGEIDAFAFVIAAPSVGIARATDECGARLMPLPAEAVARVVGEMPGTAATVVARGTYATTSQPVPTIGVVVLMATTLDEDADTVYALTRAVMQHLAEIRGHHPALADLRPPSMIADGVTVPLHPGAIRYYRERGWL